WYPKPAVYDQNGWHPMPYLDQGEFYSEFGSFDVSITLPANYTVGATGILQNQEELERLNQLAAATAAKTEFDASTEFPASASQTKTLRYVQDNIHDFAWFADKRYQVLKSEVTLPHSGRTVTTWQLFLGSNAKDWLAHKTDIDTATYYYSLWVGDYPYDQVTAVDGALSAGAGMEYPMVTVTVPAATIHEVGHNWFYGILGSNERQYPWMDEGINSYIENRISRRGEEGTGQMDFLVNNKSLSKFLGIEELNSNAVNQLPYQMGASRGLDQPIQLQASDYTSINYGTIVYMKTAEAFAYLQHYLGTSRFDSAMHAYYQKWKFKHPGPDDIQRVFEKETGENLSWFFDELLPRTAPIKIALKDVEKTGSSFKVRLVNEGNFPVPAQVAALDASGNILETQWTKPFSGETHLYFDNTQAHSFVIDPEFVIPEVNRRDNRIRTSGILRKWEPLKFQFLAGIEQPKKAQVYFSPVIGYNTYNKFMAGAALHNSSLIQRKLSYLVMPMYSFGSNSLNGIVDLNYNLIPQQIARQVKLSLNGRRFEQFVTGTLAMDVDFRRSASDKPYHSLRLAGVVVSDHMLDAYTYSTQYLRYGINLKNALQELTIAAQVNYYQFDNSDNQIPFQYLSGLPDLYNVRSTYNQSSVQAEAAYSRYYKQNKQFRARVFGGKFLSSPNPYGNNYFRFGMSGSLDYFKETVFIDRAQFSDWLTAFEHQTDNREGAFKSQTNVYTDNWLTTLNLEADLPVTPFSVFADFGKVADSDKLYYDAGLSLHVINNFLHIYFPMVGTNYTQTGTENKASFEDFKDFRNNIRFYLNLNMLSPFKQIDKALGGK
ncbi:MAG: M1 family metallopeptidase, partial [Hymenobacteraceae bacterium]|nr:M1 family metallopeptidase [Hymenobacteraceae bacterium]MDX5397493.1 M1 family metallopeptidase [Hymenobacteraceae bacterium]MDX5513569.1 M1 family metallopeptidase [Hymenobacteraceae bacterium]